MPRPGGGQRGLSPPQVSPVTLGLLATPSPGFNQGKIKPNPRNLGPCARVWGFPAAFEARQEPEQAETNSPDTVLS